MWDLRAELEALRDQGLERRPRALAHVHGARCRADDGRELLVFCSNDYLGLADDPSVTMAFTAAAREYGVGAGASHLISGHRPVHDALAEALAEWLNRDRALLFSTGYMANAGVIGSFVGRGDLVHQDRLNHASLLDGARASGARLLRYRHGDPASLAGGLERQARRHLVVTDGVFSMDGDMAPLPALAELAREADAALLVDDAHGLGVLGPEGRGSVAATGLGQSEVPLLVGTLGKAFGTFGAFVAGPSDWIELVQQRARTLIYTTAPPPALAAATLESLRLIREEPWRRTHLAKLIRRFREGVTAMGLPLLPSDTPIQPLLVGDAGAAVAASRALEERGLLVTAIRPPTVPKGSSRLRVTLSAAHSESQVDRLLDALEAIRPQFTGGANEEDGSSA